MESIRSQANDNMSNGYLTSVCVAAPFDSGRYFTVVKKHHCTDFDLWLSAQKYFKDEAMLDEIRRDPRVRDGLGLLFQDFYEWYTINEGQP